MSNNNFDSVLQKFKKRLLALEKYKVCIGIPKEIPAKDISELEDQREDIKRSLGIKTKMDSNVIYVADKAFKNDFGSYAEKIPPRPFGSTTIPRYKDEINKIIDKELKDYTDNKKSVKVVFNRIGIAGQKYMRKNLIEGNWKANSPITRIIKGSSKPLIDTGEMRQAITYVVKKKDEE